MWQELAQKIIKHDVINNNEITTSKQDNDKFEINVYLRNKNGRLFLYQRQDQDIEHANSRHDSLVRRYKETGTVHYCYLCGEVAFTQYILTGRWYCSTCWDLGPGQNGG